MTIYKDPRTLKTVSISGLEGSEVKIWNTLLWGELEKLYEAEGSDIAKGRLALSYLIKDWNLTNEKNEKLPIDGETIKTFTVEMITFLLSQTDFSAQEISGVKKKIE